MFCNVLFSFSSNSWLYFILEYTYMSYIFIIIPVWQGENWCFKRIHFPVNSLAEIAACISLILEPILITTTYLPLWIYCKYLIADILRTRKLFFKSSYKFIFSCSLKFKSYWWLKICNFSLNYLQCSNKSLKEWHWAPCDKMKWLYPFLRTASFLEKKILNSLFYN